MGAHLPFWKMLSSLIATTIASAPKTIDHADRDPVAGLDAGRAGRWIRPPLVAAAQLVPGGPAVYLGSGLLLTAAHVVNPGADISVVIARVKLPAKVLKQGAYEEIDLSLLHFDLRSLDRLLAVLHQDLMAQQRVALDFPRYSTTSTASSHSMADVGAPDA